MNMIEVLSCRFHKCFGPSTMWLVEGSSKTGLLRHLSNHVFGVHNLRNTKTMRVILASKCLKFNIDFKMQPKIEKKFFVSGIIASELVPLNCLC